jgi:hypothetical protein
MTAVAADARCSVLAQQIGEPLSGSAPLAKTWVVLEQSGPYGFKALRESHLPRAVGDQFAAATEKSAVTVVIARRVGPHVDVHRPGPHRFWIAHTSPSGVRMRAGSVDDLHDLLVPDLTEVMARAGRGELPAWGQPTTTPLLLVCTNGKRDVCCALTGRPLAAALAADPAYADNVLEASHLGGHRFAPTALLLPVGMVYGRLSPDGARHALDEARAGRVSAVGSRGRTALARPFQAADLAVRHAFGITDDGLAVLRSGNVGKLLPAPLRWDADGADESVAVVRHQDGRAWEVAVRREHADTPRHESCNKAPVDPTWWTAGKPLPVPAWR